MKREYALAPVVVFVYNRPKRTRNLLDNLNTLPEAVDCELYIFSDNAKAETEIEKVKEVRKEIKEFVDTRSLFKNVTIENSISNKGLAKSIIEGVTKVINKYGNVIVLEDDLIVSNDFLSYMNDGLNYYRNNEQIWSISGYSFPLNVLNNYQHDIYLTGRASSWGWATWKDRWEMIDWNLNDYCSMKFNFFRRLKFAKWGKDMPTMLDACVYGKIDSWAIRWCYAQFRQEKFSVCPKYSRVKNIGTDGSGTHFKKKEHKYDTVLYSGFNECKFERVPVNIEIQKEFVAIYMSVLGWIKTELIWLIRKICVKEEKERIYVKDNQTQNSTKQRN